MSNNKLADVGTKLKDCLRKVKGNFKADEGSAGFQRVKSRFVNLWKSGTAGRTALIGSSFMIIFALIAICTIGGSIGGGDGQKTGNSKDRIQEILKLAEKTAEEKKCINFCGFFVGMSKHDHAALREYYKLESGEWGLSMLGTTVGETAVWRLFFSLNAVQRMTNGGSTLDELAKDIARRIGSLDRKVNYNNGNYWFERKTIDGTIVTLTTKGLTIKNERLEKKAPIETSAAEADRMAKISEFETRMGSLLPTLITDMVDIPGKNYKIGKYEVTQAQWEALMENNPSNLKNPDNPVENVSWRDCREFINRLNLLPTVKNAGLVFRLPTDTEWRGACRSDMKGDYPIYCTLADGTQITEDTLDEVAWYSNNSGGNPHPVGQKKPNAFGLYDMLGNVSEWTGSTDDSSVIPIDRGGCYKVGKSSCKSDFGYDHGMDYKDKTIGLRLLATSISK